MKTSLSFAAPWDAGVKLLTMLVSGILGYSLQVFNRLAQSLVLPKQFLA